ncbi:MAG: hypothetical protein J6X57_01755 [Bacteroidales bacterium]|nr:hypothetical protein [Bacteroidales bacterium]
MKKLVLIAFLLVCGMFSAGLFRAAAQNNPYDIDDECYKYFKEAELLVGKPGFDEVNDALLHAAITKGDTKAQTLYYVERLKNAIRLIPTQGSTTPEEDTRILKFQEELKEVANKYGFPQYYYYSYELVQNYFFNHRQPIRTMELLQEMQQTAADRKEPYGEWLSYRYMVALYISQSDYVTAKKYILKAINIHETTKDPIVRKQTIARLYCDLSDTYAIGMDSVKICLNKAQAASQLHLDTLRCEYHLAKLAAYEKRTEDYYHHRDYCYNDPQLNTISVTAAKLFETLDSIIEGHFDYNKVNDLAFSRVREVKYIANVAEVYGYKDQAFELERLLVRKFERQLASLNQSKIAEMDARLGNKILSAELATKTTEVQNIYRLVMILLIILLIGILIFLIAHINSLRKHNKQLEEANEKVMLANAAKTRFVQNMSHEVRTPLNAIVGFSQLLSLPDGTFSPEEKEEFSGHIINNTKMLTMLLDDILNTTAMDSGNYRIQYEEGECGFMCQAAISSAEHRLQPGVTMRYEQDFEGPYTFRTDPRRVQQIIINLLTNACKHTQEGEIVLKCSLNENPGEVTFSVTDSGTGVPADMAEKIFERFAKLNEFVQGTGLGLPICRDIAGLMGGRVFLDTTYAGKGARFVFVLPVVPPENTDTTK